MTTFQRSSLPTARVIAIVLCMALASVAFAGCGQKDEPEPDEVTNSQPQPTETVDPLPELPDRWAEVVNGSGGYALGVPPGWTETTDGARTVLSSPDELLTITVVADRTRGALEMPLEEFARRTAETLGSETQGRQRLADLEVFAPAPFRHAYDAFAYRAFGESVATGVPLFALVVVIRREDLATYVAILQENALEESEVADRDTVKRVIRSVRGRPIAGT